MTDNYIHITIRRDTTENWLASNPVLQLGEIAYDTDKHGLKVGDGKHRWSALPFCGADFNDLEQRLTQLIKDSTTPVEDTLDSTNTTSALSAAQGHVLKELIDGKVDAMVTDLKDELAKLINSNIILVEDTLTSTNTASALSAEQGRVLKELVDKKVDAMVIINLKNELAQMIKENTIPTEDNLTSTSTERALSANQGRVLMGLIGEKADPSLLNNLKSELIQLINSNTVLVEDSLESRSTTKALSANQGRALMSLLENKVDKFTLNNLLQQGQGEKVTIVDDLVSTNSRTDALSAYQGYVLSNEIKQIADKNTALTVNIGTVTTGDAGINASVTNVGTPTAAVLDFVIPKGAKGDRGEKGTKGEKGEKGDKGDTGAAADPVAMRYRIVETIYAPARKDEGIVETYTKGTDARLSYAEFEGDSKYRVFTVPKGVYKVVISACGGGGGGFVMNNVFYSGGNASSIKDYIFDVSPNDKIYIYAGRGGRGCSKTLADDNTCSDGEDTEIRIGDSKSNSLIAEQIIHCQGGYSALTINSNPANATPTVNGACQEGTSQAQTVSRPYPPALSSYADLKKLLMGFASESTLVPPYGAGGAFNTTWQRLDNYAGTHGIVIVKYIGVY